MPTSQNIDVFGRPLAAFFRQLFALEAQILSPEEIENAKRLLYKVYFEEQKWIPPAGNPSGFRITDGKYEDELHDFRITWIGLYLSLIHI